MRTTYSHKRSSHTRSLRSRSRSSKRRFVSLKCWKHFTSHQCAIVTTQCRSSSRTKTAAEQVGGVSLRDLCEDPATNPTVGLNMQAQASRHLTLISTSDTAMLLQCLKRISRTLPIASGVANLAARVEAVEHAETVEVDEGQHLSQTY